ncbi:MAG: hypothetical protein K2W77_02900 [Tabrizicola sp.]|jgi:hypothetical protein|nr:hypothetical protein [Tabrizicola sp.]
MRVGVIVGVLALGLFMAFQGCFGSSSTSWNQRLTLVIETPQGGVSGSSVTGRNVVNSTGAMLPPDARGPRGDVTGEAVVIEVMPGRWLFALIDGSDSVLRTAKGWPEAAYGLSSAADGRQRDYWEQMRVLKNQPLDTPVPLPPEAWPMLVTFDDITKPETVREVDPEDLAAVFGEGVRLKAVTLEITEEAVTVGRVGVLLPWLGPYQEPALGPWNGETLAEAPFYLRVHMGDFIRRPE